MWIKRKDVNAPPFVCAFVCMCLIFRLCDVSTNHCTNTRAKRVEYYHEIELSCEKRLFRKVCEKALVISMIPNNSLPKRFSGIEKNRLNLSGFDGKGGI